MENAAYVREEGDLDREHVKNGGVPGSPRSLRSQSSVVTVESDQVVFAWDNICVRTKQKQKQGGGGSSWTSWMNRNKDKDATPRTQKTILHGVSGFVRPGELLAVMGASGAGKTTLLNTLTYRNMDELEVTNGSRLANGVVIRSPNMLTAVSAYVQQDDIFYANLTVREHLQFQAMLRMDRHLPMSERMKRVDDVLHELGLKKCEGSAIGLPGGASGAGLARGGISGGERKRLSFASEVLTNPPLLFCDEPTTGLDSYMAQTVVQVLRTLAGNGKSVLCTIHQPSSQVFALFDRVLLMAEGRLAFLGSVQEAEQFFERCNHPCPLNYNPAEHFIHFLAITPGKEEECRNRITEFVDRFHSDPEGHHIRLELAHQKAHPGSIPAAAGALVDADSKHMPSPYKANWLEQFRAVMWRSSKAVIREPLLINVRFSQTILTSLLIGVMYLNQELHQENVMNINGALFTILSMMNFQNIYAVINVFCTELPIFMREHFNGMYRCDVYYISKQLCEFPIFVLIPILFVSIMYWMTGLNPLAVRFVACLIIAILFTQVIVAFGYMLSCLASNITLAMAIAPPLFIPIMLFGGFFINSASIPAWLVWLEYLSWFRYGNELLIVNQWAGVNLTCDSAVAVASASTLSSGMASASPSSFSCVSPLSEWSMPVPGHYRLDAECVVATRNETPACPFPTGDAVIESMGFNKDHMALDIFMLIMLSVIFRIIGFLALVLRTRRKIN